MIIVAAILAVPLAAGAQEELFSATISLKCSAENTDQTNLIKSSIATTDVITDCPLVPPAARAAYVLVYDPVNEEMLIVERCTKTPVGCTVVTFGVGSDLEILKDTVGGSSSTTTTTVKGFRFMSFSFGGATTDDFGAALFSSTDTLKSTAQGDIHTFKLTAKVQGAHLLKDGTVLCEGKIAVGKALKDCPAS